MSRRRALTAALAVLALGGCAAFAPDNGGGGTDGGSGGGTGQDGTTAVLASFYPLQYLAEEIGGDRLSVSSLTPPGVDPHNVELSPRTVAEMGDAALVIYLSGFQPAVDEGVSVTAARPFDAAEHTELLTTAQTGHDHGDGDHGGHDHAEDGHTEDDHAEDGHAEDDHDGGAANLDPHFWLDPERLAEVGRALAAELGEIDPEGAATYRENSERVTAELEDLATELATGLARCEQRTIVVAHEAYGYLTNQHDLTQEGLSGIDPESEPSPARLAEVADVVAEHGVDTIFVESLLSPAVSEALARDLDLRTAVLDPLENQQDDSADYLDVMRANLAALQEALGCAA